MTDINLRDSELLMQNIYTFNISAIDRCSIPLKKESAGNGSFYIYVLTDDSWKIKYVGQTCNPRRRYLDHIQASKHGRTLLYNWVKCLNKKPIMIIVQQCKTVNEINLAEHAWISVCHPTKNHTAGGDRPDFIVARSRKYNFELKKIIEFINSGMTVRKMAEFYGCSIGGIRKFLRRNNLITKNAAKCRPDGSFTEIPSRQIITKEELIELYCVQKLTCRQIGTIKKCSKTAILAWLTKLGIERRTRSESMKYQRGMSVDFRAFYQRDKNGITVGD